MAFFRGRLSGLDWHSGFSLYSCQFQPPHQQFSSFLFSAYCHFLFLSERLPGGFYFIPTWLTGILVWLIARPSYHIGASGLVYSFAAFLFASGIIRRNINLLAISMLVIFLYGSMVWGIFPYRPDMSWESHLMGLTIGVILAISYRHEGPGPTKFISDMEDDDEGRRTGRSYGQ